MRSASQSCKYPDVAMYYPGLLRGKQAALFHFTGSPGAAGIVTGRTKETRAGSRRDSSVH